MKSRTIQALQFILVVALSLSLYACGKKEETPMLGVAESYALRSTSNFAGTWNMKLKGIKDGCKLGLKGKSFPGTIVVAQKAKKVTLTIQGIPKAFKGTVNGNVATTSGKYVVSGITMTGTIVAKLTGAKSMKLSSATLVLKTSKVTCTVLLSGSGKR